MPKNTSRLSRQRGFAWERQIAKEFEKLGWISQRLGGSGLPDVLARNDDFTRSYIIEAKSGYSKYLYIPKDQVIRQIKWVEYGLLKSPRSLLAFKFAAGHTPTYFFWLMPLDMTPCGITCRNDGLVTKTGARTILGYCKPNLETLILDDLAEAV